MIGINALSKFAGNISENSPRLTAEDLLNHLDHIVNLVGVKHVGLGFDFCDRLQNFLMMPESLGTYDVLEGHGSLYKITSELIKRGYSDEEIVSILGGNFMRVFEATL